MKWNQLNIKYSTILFSEPPQGPQLDSLKAMFVNSKSKCMVLIESTVSEVVSVIFSWLKTRVNSIEQWLFPAINPDTYPFHCIFFMCVYLYRKFFTQNSLYNISISLDMWNVH